MPVLNGILASKKALKQCLPIKKLENVTNANKEELQVIMLT